MKIQKHLTLRWVLGSRTKSSDENHLEMTKITWKSPGNEKRGKKEKQQQQKQPFHASPWVKTEPAGQWCSPLMSRRRWWRWPGNCFGDDDHGEDDHGDDDHGEDDHGEDDHGDGDHCYDDHGEDDFGDNDGVDDDYAEDLQDYDDGNDQDDAEDVDDDDRADHGRAVRARVGGGQGHQGGDGEDQSSHVLKNLKIKKGRTMEMDGHIFSWRQCNSWSQDSQQGRNRVYQKS